MSLQITNAESAFYVTQRVEQDCTTKLLTYGVLQFTIYSSSKRSMV
jgi:hypothetical protein